MPSLNWVLRTPYSSSFTKRVLLPCSSSCSRSLLIGIVWWSLCFIWATSCWDYFYSPTATRVIRFFLAFSPTKHPYSSGNVPISWSLKIGSAISMPYVTAQVLKRSAYLSWFQLSLTWEKLPISTELRKLSMMSSEMKRDVVPWTMMSSEKRGKSGWKANTRAVMFLWRSSEPFVCESSQLRTLMQIWQMRSLYS